MTMGVAEMAALSEDTEVRKVMKMAIQQLLHRINRWRNAVAVEWYQDGNTVRVRIRRYGFFKQYSGIPLLCDIKIDPTLTTQSDERCSDTDCSWGKSTVKRDVKLLISRVQLWCWRVYSVVDWYREGDTIYLKLQRCGLFKEYTGTPIICDISINKYGIKNIQ